MGEVNSWRGESSRAMICLMWLSYSMGRVQIWFFATSLMLLIGRVTGRPWSDVKQRYWPVEDSIYVRILRPTESLLKRLCLSQQIPVVWDEVAG